MPTKNGLSARVIAHVAAHPGQLPREIGVALGFKHGSGLLTYLMKTGKLFAAGPRHWHRLYPTAEAAAAVHEQLCEEAKAIVARKIAATAKRSTIVRKARYAATITKRRPPADAVFKPVLKDGALLHPDVRVTLAPKPRNRFDPEPGWAPVFTQDWIERTQAAANAAAVKEVGSDRRAA